MERKRYLRYGELSPNGRSINFLNLNISQNKDFAYDLENYGIEKAYENIPEKAFESGISVFEMDEDGLPYLPHLQMIHSLLSRLDHPVYEVSGIECGRGMDSEPLLKDVKIEKRRRIKTEKIIDKITRIFLKNFKVALFDDKDPTWINPESRNIVFDGTTEQYINIHTGEVQPGIILLSDNPNDWLKQPRCKYVNFNQWTFYQPVDEFDTDVRDRRLKKGEEYLSPEAQVKKLEEENKALRNERCYLQAKNEHLKQENDHLISENKALKCKLRERR